MTEGFGHNSVANDELRQFVEQFEQLEMEKKGISDRQKEVMAEAKGRGYDTKIMRRIISDRKKDPSQRDEEDALFELYKSALGM